MADLKVSMSKVIDAPVDQVFDAWLNPELLGQFMLPMPGMPFSEVRIDAEVGGSFEITMNVGGKKVSHTGSYLEVVRPEKLVFSWVSPASRDDSVVTLLFTSAGDAQTALELTHVKFFNEERRENHQKGWGSILVALQFLMVKQVR